MRRPIPAFALGWALIFALFLAIGFSACAERRAVRFPHLTHLAGLACGAPGGPACLTCNSCHSASSEGVGSVRADTARCGSCHHSDAGLVK